MRHVVVLNGPAGVGKTTTGRLLAAMSSNGVCIEGDTLKNFIVTRQEGRVKGRLGYKNGASLIQNFIDAGYELIVFEYVFPSKDPLVYFLDLLMPSPDIRVHVTTLWAPLDVVVAREAGRKNRERLGNRVVETYKELESSLESLGSVIMTDDGTPEEIAAKIFLSLQEDLAKIEGMH